MFNCKKAACFIMIGMLAGMTACGGDVPAAETTSGGDTTAAPVDAGPKLEIPEKDFGGYTVTFLAVDKYTDHFKIIAEEQNGDTLNDAGYKRARAVGDLLNVEFDKFEVADAAEVGTVLQTSVMAGDGAYDFVLPHANNGVAALVTSGSLLDWNALEHVDFEKPWWNSNMQESISIAGKMFFASGDITMTWQGFGALLFNKQYLTDYKIADDPYKLVWDGKWTMDAMYAMMSGVGKDLNGDAQMTEVDQYGLLMHSVSGTAIGWQFGAGQHVTTSDADGCPVLDMNNDRMIGIVEKMSAIASSPDTFRDVYYSTTYTESTYRSMLESGRSFFTWMDIGSMHSYLRDINFEFGILPQPKYDEAQEEYYSVSAAGIIGVPADAADPARTGIIAEALAYYSYEYIRPAFFDVVLQNKAVQDEDSYKVIQMLHENRCFDVAYNFTTTPSAIDIFGKVVLSNGSTNFASYYDSVKDAINQSYRDIYEAVKAQ